MLQSYHCCLNLKGVKTVLITGATGLIGTELTRSLRSKDVTVKRLTTGAAKGDFDYSWNPSTNSIGKAYR